MTMRPLQLPQDLIPLEGMLIDTFQYPENPEWSIQADEQEELARELRSLRKLWPLLRMAQVIAPALRDLFRGFIWEEDGRIGGVVITQRAGKTDLWSIAVVGVLPEFRRRGLARKLLTRTLEDVRDRGAQRIVLGVIEKNVPAYGLYKSLGFEHYTSVTEFDLHPTARPAVVALPDGLEGFAIPRRHWGARFELEKRVSPASVQRYEPVEEGRFRPPAPMRALLPVMDRIRGLVQGRLLYKRDGEIVGHLVHRTAASGKGTSSISVRMDPDRPEIAAYMMTEAVRQVTDVNPTLRVQCTIPTWVTPLIRASEDLGFKERVRYDMLGIILS